MVQVDGTYGSYLRRQCVLDRETPHSKLVHVFRLATTARAEDSAKVERDVHVLQLFNHEHVLAPCGVVPTLSGIAGVVFDVLPHELRDALAGRPALTLTEEIGAVLAIALALEFLGARRLYFSQIKTADVGLTSAHVAKVRCFGVTTTEDNVQEAAVVVAYGWLLKEILDGSSHFKHEARVGDVADRCIDGRLCSLCELTLDMRQVRAYKTGLLDISWTTTHS